MSESLYCRTCARIHRAGNLPKGLVATLLSRIITLTGIVVLIGCCLGYRARIPPWRC
ncbi:TPA: hypothetical protein PC641_004877 [Klebsiella variicola]|nr:hypothetical protein [Klebsiella variicola]